MVCVITGIAGKPDGTVYALATFMLSRNPRSVVSQGGRVVAPINTLVVSDAAGVVNFSALAGNYLGTELTSKIVFSFTVPGTPTADWAACVAAPVMITPIEYPAAQLSGTLQAAQEPAHTGDVTNLAGSLALTIAPDAVTFAKMQNITDARLMGRNAGSTGDMQHITLGTGLSFTGTTLNADAGGSDAIFTLQDDIDATKQAKFQLSGITTATTRTFTLPNADGTLATLSGIAQTFINTTTFAGAVTIGTSASAMSYTFGGGATTTGLTKAVNIGTGGASGSTTTIAIGSSVAGALGTTTFQTPTVAFGATVTEINLPDAATFLVDSVDATKKLQFDVAGVTTATTRTVTVPDASGAMVLDTATQTLSNKTQTAPVFSVTTLAGLPVATNGRRAHISDSFAAPVFNAVAVGGGTVSAPVFADGMTWRYG